MPYITRLPQPMDALNADVVKRGCDKAFICGRETSNGGVRNHQILRGKTKRPNIHWFVLHFVVVEL